jgi:hypothetical protein
VHDCGLPSDGFQDRRLQLVEVLAVPVEEEVVRYAVSFRANSSGQTVQGKQRGKRESRTS